MRLPIFMSRADRGKTTVHLLLPALFLASAFVLPTAHGSALGAQSATSTVTLTPSGKAAPTATLVLSGKATPTATRTSSGTASSRPNIVVLMTDDENVSDMQVMPKVQSLLADKGVTFTDSFVSYPLCCPSRTTFLTGQYTHNHGVWANLPNREGYQQFMHQETTFPAALHDAGYRTFHVGKYLNGYGRTDPTKVPPGWDEWHGSIDPTTYRYYGFKLNNDGALHTYGSRPKYYSTDYYTDLATSFIRNQAATGQPFFLNLAYLAPHSGGAPTDVPGVMAPPPGVKETVPCAPQGSHALRLHRALYPLTTCKGGQTRRPVTDGFAVPAPRYADAFHNVALPKSPSFNEPNMADKPKFLQNTQEFPRLTNEEISVLTTAYRERLASLLAVDDSVERIVQTLSDTHQIDNTVIIFTSDNGYFFGQHRIPFGKYWPYEEAIRVPLIIRAPGMPEDVKRSAPVVNVDLAPTILSFAHVRGLREMDGRSLIPLMRNPSTAWNRDILLEGNTGNAVPYEGIQTSRYVYIQYRTGARELYDLKTDPYELNNRWNDFKMQAVREDLQLRLDRLMTCSGSTCWNDTARR